jgi:hypothetical protein
MIGRLWHSIEVLISEAHQTHSKLNANESNPDAITRISTNEFFFYTQKPLTLQEFQELQNNIARKAATLPSGVQLILASFAVKTADNQVMNVTAHVSCGQPPSFQFIVKNNTSLIDVRYKQRDESDHEVTLRPMDVYSQIKILPEIEIGGEKHSFTFNNIIACRTPGGSPFLTAIDICLDHEHGVALANMQTAVRENPELASRPLSYVVVANSVTLQPQYCLGTAIHVDPTVTQSPETQSSQRALTEAVFGNNGVILLDKSEPLLTAQQAIDLTPAELARAEFKLDADLAFRQLKTFLKHFESSVRPSLLSEIRGFIQSEGNAISSATNHEKRQDLLQKAQDLLLKAKIDQLFSCLITLKRALKPEVRDDIIPPDFLDLARENVHSNQEMQELYSKAENLIERAKIEAAFDNLSDLRFAPQDAVNQEFLSSVSSFISSKASLIREADTPSKKRRLLESTADLLLIAKIEKSFVDLKNLKLSPEDTVMEQYIAEKKIALSNTSNMEERENLFDQLEKTVEKLNRNHQTLMHVKSIIAMIKKNSLSPDIAMESDKIERGLNALSLRDRPDPDRSEFFRRAMDFIGKNTELLLLDENEAAKTAYVDYRQRFRAEVLSMQQADEAPPTISIKCK